MSVHRGGRSRRVAVGPGRAGPRGIGADADDQNVECREISRGEFCFVEDVGLNAQFFNGFRNQIAGAHHVTDAQAGGVQVHLARLELGRQVLIVGAQSARCWLARNSSARYHGAPTPLPAGQILCSRGASPRRRSRLAVQLPALRHPHLRWCARRWQCVLEFHEAVGHAASRSDPGLQLRSRSPCRSLRSLRLPSLGALRPSGSTRSPPSFWVVAFPRTTISSPSPRWASSYVRGDRLCASKTTASVITTSTQYMMGFIENRVVH